MTDVATTSPNAAGLAPSAAAAPQKLDDLMLAMDVVDTLRHQETVALRELDDDARKAALVTRLKKLYADQGIEVPDAIIEEGVRSLEESRFSYTPTPPSLSRTLAVMWIDRGRWAAIIGGTAVALAVAIGGYSYFVVGGAERAAEAQRVEITRTLPAELTKAVQTARDEAKVPAATARVDTIAQAGQAALTRQDAPAAKAAIADATALTSTLREVYQIRVVSRPGVRSGVYRLPPNKASRNFYLIVEAIGPSGQALPRVITSEETQQTKTVTIWGQRVPQATYDRVAADKADDGIIENPVLGDKRRGEIDVRWAMPTSAGAITEW
ncbi:MAG: hypothetical protein GX458_07815 [Phyllobacteriaceae bacterium]|nr:hypothetical protein [Phyllobacteriaceae bacterium]